MLSLSPFAADSRAVKTGLPTEAEAAVISIIVTVLCIVIAVVSVTVSAVMFAKKRKQWQLQHRQENTIQSKLL